MPTLVIKTFREFFLLISLLAYNSQTALLLSLHLLHKFILKKKKKENMLKAMFTPINCLFQRYHKWWRFTLRKNQLLGFEIPFPPSAPQPGPGNSKGCQQAALGCLSAFLFLPAAPPQAGTCWGGGGKHRPLHPPPPRAAEGRGSSPKKRGSVPKGRVRWRRRLRLARSD